MLHVIFMLELGLAAYMYEFLAIALGLEVVLRSGPEKWS